MRTLITSDIHFFHKNIIVYCGRPHADEYEMNSHIAKVWQEQVTAEDRVLVVGDISAGLAGRNDALHGLLSGLPGRKFLIRGNHDHKPDSWYIEAGFEQVLPWLWEDGVLFVHKPATAGNDEVLDLREKFEPSLIIHGHIHSMTNGQIPGHFNVAWDWHGRLVDYDEILRQCNLSRSTV
jgi:calcineurin-like phosphoesterase family protein